MRARKVKMEDVRIVLCDSSPAKRAKLEWNSTQTNVGNTSDGKIRHQSNSIQCLSNGNACCEAGNKETCFHLTDSENPTECNFVEETEKNDFRDDEVFGVSRNEGVSSSSDGLTENETTDINNYNQDITTVPDSSNEFCSNHDDDDDDDDFDEVASTISNISGLSDLSDMSGLDWKPIAGPFLWVQRQMELGSNPRNLLQELVPVGTVIPDHLDDVTLWKIICNILSEPPTRSKLSHVNTLDDVVELLKVSKKIIVLTGAGVSVSSGIPDFRSRDGIYARLAKDFPDLPDPQAMFDIHYFRKDPRPFFKFAREIYPGQFEPSLSHKFIKLLEDHGKLLRNYSQNIDTLEQIAGIQKVVQCHGSFATASCTKCGFKVTASHIKNDVFEQNIPKCPKCITDSSDEELAVMKPDIVFFGEGLPEEFHSTMAEDKDDCDLLIVVGSSLKVRPVALIPFSIPENVPQILINREPLKHVTFDVELLGDCDVIVNEICLRLNEGWRHIAQFPKLEEQIFDINNSLPTTNDATTSKIISRRISTGGLCDSTSDNNNSASSSSSSSTNTSSSSIDHAYVTSSEDDGNDPDSTFNVKKNFSTELPNVPDGSYFFSSPNCYIFSGAEVTIVTSSENEENHSCGSGEDSGVGDLRPSCDVRTVMTSREYF